ncbi:hypothetical protein CRG98_039036 [Punica granatum]|uniref:Uncharacterized protein n=1 Tax=Punica granatum TaxID=22663 RepID=A0A2I0I988_PUNGR|nr:hypothetical protein CRG98_039036 [Punica granatum]
MGQQHRTLSLPRFLSSSLVRGDRRHRQASHIDIHRAVTLLCCPSFEIPELLCRCIEGFSKICVSVTVSGPQGFKSISTIIDRIFFVFRDPSRFLCHKSIHRTMVQCPFTLSARNPSAKSGLVSTYCFAPSSVYVEDDSNRVGKAWPDMTRELDRSHGYHESEMTLLLSVGSVGPNPWLFVLALS